MKTEDGCGNFMSEIKKQVKKAAGRTVPYNLEAEQCVLGCMMADGGLVQDIVALLVEDDFYTPANRTVFAAIYAVHRSSKAVDFVTIADELSRTGNMASIGGISYLTTLSETVPGAANYKDYLTIVKRDASMRNLIRECGKIIEEAYSADDRDKMMAAAEKSIYDLNVTGASRTLTHARDNVGEVFKKLEIISKDPNALKGVMSGFKKLDRLTNGFQPGNLVVIAGRPGQGKSSLAMNIVENASVYGDKVCAVFSLEMTAEEITRRMLFSVKGISMTKGLSGSLRPQDWSELIKAHSLIANSKVYIDDSQITPDELLSKCRRLKSNQGLDLVVIDYIQLMQDKKKAESRQQEIASFTRNLKQIAKELNVPIIALSQLNRAVEDGNKKPQLSHLRESGAIEQDADIVILIHKPNPDASFNGIDDIDLILAKNRNGATDDVQVKWIKEFVRFADPDSKIVGRLASDTEHLPGIAGFELAGLEAPPEEAEGNEPENV